MSNRPVPPSKHLLIGGYTIGGVICEPKGCPALETVAATTTGIGTLVGIGLVVAPATRSFAEYQEAVRRDSTRSD